MSIDYFLYALGAPPPRSTLAKALMDRGWTWDVGGDLDDPITGGVVSASKGPTSVSCGIAVAHPFNPVEEFGDDWEDERPAKVAREIRRAKTMFTVSSSAAGAVFLSDVCNALADVAPGLIEDPQADEYVKVGPKGRKTLGDDLPSPSPALHAYFKSVKRGGFRVAPRDPHGFRTWMEVEDLTREGMDALLRTTEAHFAADASAGREMIASILSQYAAHGRPSEWFEALRLKYGATR